MPSYMVPFVWAAPQGGSGIWPRGEEIEPNVREYHFIRLPVESMRWQPTWRDQLIVDDNDEF